MFQLDDERLNFGTDFATGQMNNGNAEVSKSHGIKVVPDPVPDEKVFYRSGHYSFVERGVPALMPMGAPISDIQFSMKRMMDTVPSCLPNGRFGKLEGGNTKDLPKEK